METTVFYDFASRLLTRFESGALSFFGLSSLCAHLRWNMFSL